MLKIRLLSPGKIKEKWLEEAIQEYVKRLSPFATFEFPYSKDDEQFAEQIKKEKLLICLDPNGKAFTSEEFSKQLFNSFEKGGSTVSFAIGGAEGFPEGAKEGRQLISLSPLTFTHQMARLILIEQIFRAFEIRKGSRYHKA